MIDADAFRELAEALLPATLDAGAAIMRHYSPDVAVIRKADESPVTAADHEAEAIILDALATVCPSVPVVAEELAAGGAAPAVDDEMFLVDPLDGTRGFIKGRTDFTVNIGYVAGGHARFGIVYGPALRRLYMTLGPDEVVEIEVGPETRTRRLADFAARRVRTRPLDRHALQVVSSRHVSKSLTARLDRMGARRIDRDSSIKFCLVANGEADFYPRLGEISQWDTAAGAGLVTAAGGCVTGIDGLPLRYGTIDGGYRNAAFVAWSTPEPPPDLLAALTSD